MIVRFNEYQRYDIQQDCEVVRFMGVTDGGTFHTEVPMRSTRQLRETRNNFKERVIELMQDGREPCEVTLG